MRGDRAAVVRAQGLDDLVPNEDRVEPVRDFIAAALERLESGLFGGGSSVRDERR